MNAKNAILRPLLLLALLWGNTACQSDETQPLVSLKKIPSNVTKQDQIADKREGPHNFYDFHHAIRTNTGDTEPRYGTSYKQIALERALNQNRLQLRGGTALPWIERGPGNVGGRTRGLWVDPRDESYLTWLAGSAGGGLWKTENGGNDWRIVTEELSNMAVTTIGGNLANPDIVYAGTGEGFNSRMVKGSGIWKSMDGGENWIVLPATVEDTKFSNIMRIVVNPSNPNELLVATRTNLRQDIDEDEVIALSHILKSTDGGASWDVVYQTNGNDPATSARVVQQIVADPENFDLLYASVRATGIIRSQDRGETWEQVFDADQVGFRRMELAVSPSASDWVYFAAESSQGAKLYLSRTGGSTWNEVRGSFGNWLSGQGWYDNTIAVHPYDSNEVFVAGAGPMLRINVTADSSRTASNLEATFEPVTDGYSQYVNSFPDVNSKGVHVDHHNIVLLPVDESNGAFYILNANDGGVAFSQDNGDTFIQTGDSFKEEFDPFTGDLIKVYPTLKGYNTSQFYGLDKMNGGDRYVGGTQDNGSWVSGLNPDSLSDWESAPSGDGFECAWHYGDPNKILESSQFNNVYRSLNGGESWQRLDLPGNGPFITRLANSKQDPDLVFGVSNLGVLRSEDFGSNWTVIDMPNEWRFSGTGNVIEVSLASPNVIWTAGNVDEDENIVVSSDGGFTFEATAPYPDANLGRVTGLTTHPTDPATAFALFSMADSPKILKTTDGGTTWNDLSGFVTNQPESTNGFPDVAVYSLLVMPFDTNQVWAGTEIGLFESLDGGQSWQYADNGLPPVSIWEMKIVNDEIVIATHGRGIWSLSLPELEGYEPLEVLLGPKIALNRAGFDGIVDAVINLRSPYDSTVITASIPIDNNEVLSQKWKLVENEVAGNAAIEFQLPLDSDSIYVGLIEVTSYVDGVPYRSATSTQFYDVDDDPITNYSNDFDQGQSDFARLGFNAYRAPGFDDAALHSPHPYPGNNQEFIAVFQKPILIDPNQSILSFDEVVLVEPGDSDDFSSIFFYDFVTVEGTTDEGRTWTTIEGYDSRDNPIWLQAYNNNRSGAPDLILERSIDLLEHFEAGEQVYLRFRLVSDPRAEGWGWSIDNLNLQSEVTTSTRPSISLALEVESFPNPFSASTTLRYTLYEKSQVQVDLFDLSGKRLMTLIQEQQPAGPHAYQVNTSRLPAGTYYCRFQADDQVKTLKWIKN